MSKQKDKQTELLKDTLIEKFGAKQIIIFVSTAYGKPDEESNVDICVIADLKGKRKIELIREMRRELLDIISIPLDILVYDEKEFHNRSSLKSTLEHKIITDGIIAHG